MSDILTFTPYLGDTFIATAVARRIKKVTGREPSLLALNNEMSGIIIRDWVGHKTFIGKPYSEFIREGSLMSKETELVTNRIGGEWQYKYNYTTDYYSKILKLCKEIIDNFTGETIYTLHNTFPHALLGKLALEVEIPVFGYYLNSFDELMISTPKGVKRAVFWDEQFIGDRISKIATGRRLTQKDFQCLYSADTVEENTITLFPNTRSKTLSAGHWDLDPMILKEHGFNVRVAVHSSEQKYFDSPLVTQVTFTDVKQLVQLITSSEFIICNDSIPYHLAWHYGVPAIVKMKGGFQREWHPRWARTESYQYIPATSYFQEEYAFLLEKAILKLV